MADHLFAQVTIVFAIVILSNLVKALKPSKEKRSSSNEDDD